MSRGCRIGAAALFLCSANLYSVRRAMTSWRAVANKEINLNLLKVRKQAFGHESSKRGSMTARGPERAVAFAEIIFALLLVKI